MSAPSAAVAPAPSSAPAANPNSKKRKEPSEAEVAQAALLDRMFDSSRSATLQAAAKRLQPSQVAESPSKKAKSAEAAAQQAREAASNPFVAAMDAASAKASASSGMTTTANGALTHATTGAPCLDFFFHMARGFPSDSVRAELAAAWAENPDTAMRVLLHARDCHGSGKGEKLIVHEGLLWLRQHKPRTYLANLLTFVRHGYIKDLVLLADLLDGNAPGPVPRPEGATVARRGRGGRAGATQPRQQARGVEAARAMWGPLGGPELELSILAEFLRADYQSLRAWKEARGKWRAEQKKSGKATEAAAAASASAPAAAKDGVSFDDAEEVQLADLQLGDAEWEQVSGSIEQLQIKDEHMSDAAASSAAPAAAAGSAEPPKQCFVSLASKWAPSERKHYGPQARRVAAMLFGTNGRFASESAMKGGMRRYRQLLSSLRAHLCVTERLCCSGQWSRIRFEAVPARCHQLLKKAFAKHEPERYAAFMGDVKKGTKQIKVKGLEPHQLVDYYYNGGELNDTVEEAWKGIVARVKEAGTFTRAVALCDVSGSMSGMPMLVSISMGLLIAALTEGAYAGRVMTFDSKPVWHSIEGETLRERVNSLKNAPWGGSTDLQANFDLILDVAVANQIPADQMPTKLFIFSDMQFNQVTGGSDPYTNFDAALQKFAAAGYKAPDIVFWNVNGALCADAPVTCERQGVSLMSGFSPMLLNVFLQAPVASESAAAGEEAKVDPMSPLGIMMAAIADYAVAVHESER